MAEPTAPLLARCRLCNRDLEGQPNQCVTDCGHVFCLSCACLKLNSNKNQCSVCQTVVKVVRQMDANGNEAQREAPCNVKFCNVTYVLYVSIWSVQDPTDKLAKLFQLDHARVIHRGKILKKGDVWPGTVVQLVGTRKAGKGTDAVSTSASWWLEFVQWLLILCNAILYPFKLIYLFFHSMIWGEEYQSLPQRLYEPVDPSAPVNENSNPATFQQPGAVPLPRPTETVE
ncbi:hypothetical protein AeNC1_000476 [Aphanomyces euteiches]|nr:hypothetical protein AeNC1_000476 [Aphanomyces euteiches]